MKYMGSKSRISKHIVPIIQSNINDNNIQHYFEPFAGGMNVIDKIDCKIKVASDYNKYVIALFEHLKNDGELLEEVPRELYNDVRANKDNGKYEDWFVGNIGFLASYNGRWFDGGYAQSGYENTKTGERYRDYYQEAKRNILKQVNDIKEVKFLHNDYINYNPKNAVVYCDPPYQGTKQYANAVNFDYDLFWNTMRKWSQNNIVLISEENAPDDFECIWEQEVSRSIKAHDKTKATEKLFILKDKK